MIVGVMLRVLTPTELCQLGPRLPVFFDHPGAGLQL